jgi:cyclohexanone monooxygenase
VLLPIEKCTTRFDEPGSASVQAHTMHEMSVDHEVVIVGAGFGGIGTAITLDRAGLSNFLIVEEADGFGGTWYWNRYPGVAVDIPSFSYQFSFARRSDWSRIYAPGEELREYAEYCAARFKLRQRTRFGTRITGATFDEQVQAWRLDTSDGDVLWSRHVIDASGVLTVPKRPEIEGADAFGGVSLHTARWDRNQDLKGKRIGVIGTGASAVQLIPALAPEAAQLTVFQRTPIWCLPKLDGPISGRLRWILGRVPGATLAARLLSQTFVELSFPFAAHYHKVVPLATIFEGQARKYLHDQVRDPELRRKLTPQYAMGCKRPSFHNEYLATFNRSNVTLETEPIERITPAGVLTRGEKEHELDVLVYATGFKVFDSGNFPKYPVAGRGGLDLESWWSENRYQAYEGVSVPGFPNYFILFGPYGYNGSSYFNLIETQTRHILRCIKRARKEGATRVEVRPEANERYFKSMLARRGNQIFWQDSCSVANSYYFDEHGDVPFRASASLETMWRANRFDLDDYRFATA